METLLQPFQFGFMQDAFLITAIIAPAAALLSCFLVLKGWSLMGDATSHAVLPGVVLAYIAGIPLIIGAFLAALFCALATGFITTPLAREAGHRDGRGLFRHVRSGHRDLHQDPVRRCIWITSCLATCWALMQQTCKRRV